jgi:hypothetical protein
MGSGDSPSKRRQHLIHKKRFFRNFCSFLFLFVFSDCSLSRSFSLSKSHCKQTKMAGAAITMALNAAVLAKMAYDAGKFVAPHIGRAVNRYLHTGAPKSAAKFMAHAKSAKPGYLSFMSKKGKERLQHVSQSTAQTAGQSLNAIHGVEGSRKRKAEEMGINYHGPALSNPHRDLYMYDSDARARLKPYLDSIGAKRTAVPRSFNQSIEHLNKGRATDGLDAYNKTFYSR